MTRVRLGEIVVFVNDVPLAARFYQRVFGFSRVPSAFQERDGVIIDAGDVRLALQSRRLSATHGGEQVSKLSAEGTPPPFELSFDVEDVDATFKRAIEAGALDLEEPHDTDWGDRIAHFRDPSGLLVGVSRSPG